MSASRHNDKLDMCGTTPLTYTSPPASAGGEGKKEHTRAFTSRPRPGFDFAPFAPMSRREGARPDGQAAHFPCTDR
jgi:hypothetical protein